MEEFMSNVSVRDYTIDKFESIVRAEKMKRVLSKKARHNKHAYKPY